MSNVQARSAPGGGAVLGWLLAAFVAPPLVWFAFGLYLEIWDVGGMLRILLSPWIWTYMALFLGSLVIVARRQLSRVAAGMALATCEAGEGASRALRFLPRFAVLWMILYCGIGPQVALLGQTLHDPFLDGWGYWLSEALAIPLILLFSVPFFITATRRLEAYAKPIALDPGIRFLSLRSKMVLSFVYNIGGAVLTMGVGALALSHTGHGSPEALLGKLLVTGLIVTAVSIANLFLMISQIVGPVEGLSGILSGLFEDFAGGRADLGQKADVDSRDEIGYLADYFNSFLVRLAALVRSIQATTLLAMEEHERLGSSAAVMRRETLELASGSTFLKDKFGDLAARVAESSSASATMRESVEATARSIEEEGRAVEEGSRRMGEMAGRIDELSSSASRGEREAGELAELARRGGEELSLLLSGIEGIEATAASIRSAVAVIQEIGERTNLLAMNASIEAAHAGAAGRGFAVVAAEIRKLAESSQRSVAEISASIQTMFQSVETARGRAAQNGQSFDRLFSSIRLVCESLAGMKEVLDGLAAEGRGLSRDFEESAAGARRLTEGARSMTGLVRPIAETLGGMGELSAATLERMTKAVEHITSIEGALGDIERNAAASAEEGRKLHGLVKALKA